MKTVNQPIRKKDAMQLLTGQPVYVNDLAPENCLIVKLLRSPHANAIIEDIKTDIAMKVPGIEAIFTWKDVDQNGKRFTLAGQTYPEPSPQDRLVLDRHVRFVGDPVAIIAGENEKCVDRAMRMIKVKYQVLDAVLDFHQAKDNPVVIHPEDNWEALSPAGGDNMRNLCAHEETGMGDVEAVLADCDVVIDRVYHTKAVQQTMMESFRTSCSIDTYGRLHIVSSTQIVFHARRIVAKALGISKAQVRVEKPRIGGGFGAKQTAVMEIYPAFVTWHTKKPCKLITSRTETLIASSPRHEMEMHVRLGASKDGRIRAIDLYTLSNTGAYGEHGTTTVGLSGHKSIPLYAKQDAFRFTSDTVYTNRMSAGAYRGYGATQGLYAVETAVNELAVQLGMDPIELRQKNILKEGEPMPAYYGEMNTSCALDRCIEQVKREIDWENKYPCKDMGNGKVRSVGIALAMQGSCISAVDVGSAHLKLNDDGIYVLKIGAADMGTGCDTILAQIAAEAINCSVDDVAVFGADTDASPYDSGSYASSTTFVTGKAVELAALKLQDKMLELGAKILECDKSQVSFDGEYVLREDNSAKISRSDLAYAAQCGNDIELEAVVTHSSPTSPPPFMAGAAEVEIDKETGQIDVIQYVAAIDCGTPVNPNLARVQAEGGILQGIGMALSENVTYNERGQVLENSLMQYKIPTRQDIGHIRVGFESSYEKQGPFGAKSIGEIVINTPSPAITAAVYNATGQWFRELPITPEKIVMGS